MKVWQDEKDQIARNRLASLRAKQKKIDEGVALDRDIEEWLAVYDLLAAPNVFAQSVYNLVGINEIMNDVAKIDNLPDKHSVEALCLLRRAWTNVDAYRYYAGVYKLIAKVCYVIMLLLGIATVAVGVVFSNIDESGSMSDMLILGLSLASAIVAGYTSFMNPARRWHVLRSASLTM